MYTEDMKTCNNCGAEIPKDAAYCDICGALCSKRLIRKDAAALKDIEKKKERRRKTRRRIFAGIGIAFAVLIALSMVSQLISNIKYERWRRQQDLSDWETVVTPEAYEQLDIGMTYEEVKSIIGGEGKVTEKSDYVTTYSWPGEYYSEDRYPFRLDVSFYKYSYKKEKEMTVDHIVEDSIVKGKEVYETKQIISEDRLADLDTPLITKQQVNELSEGMTYEQVCEIMEGEGRLYSSRTYVSEARSTEYSSYVWRCRYYDRDDYFDLSFEDGILKELYEWKVDYID